jgi:hypothetical protein
MFLPRESCLRPSASLATPGLTMGARNVRETSLTSENISTLPAGKVSAVLLVDFHVSLAALAIALIVLGIGAMRARRWAWALNLILSWLVVPMSAVLAIMSWVNTPQDKHGRDDLSRPFFFVLCHRKHGLSPVLSRQGRRADVQAARFGRALD